MACQTVLPLRFVPDWSKFRLELTRGSSYSTALCLARHVRRHPENALTFAEIVGSLRQYDKAPLGAQSTAIFVAEPWAPSSEATVEWSSAKGGVPLGRKPILFYLTTVKAALRILGSEYDDLAAHGDVEAMCSKLAHHVTEMNAQRVRHDVDVAPQNIGEMSGEFAKIGPNQASSTKGFKVIFHPA